MAGPTPTVLVEQPCAVLKMWPSVAQSVGGVRRLLAEHLGVWGLPELSDDAGLVVSELFTNAVAHAHPPYGEVIATRFERLVAGVRIEVHDASERRPERREVSGDAVSGRGLVLVDALTRGRWGVGEREGVGKVVWAVVLRAEDVAEVAQ